MVVARLSSAQMQLERSIGPISMHRSRTAVIIPRLKPLCTWPMSEKCAGRRSAVANTQEIHSLSLSAADEKGKSFFFLPTRRVFLSFEKRCTIATCALIVCDVQFSRPRRELFLLYVRLRSLERCVEIDKTVNLFGFSQMCRDPHGDSSLLATHQVFFFFETSEENFSLFSFPPSTSPYDCTALILFFFKHIKWWTRENICI